MTRLTKYREKWLFCSKTLDSLTAWLGEKRKTEFSWTPAIQAVSESRVFEQNKHFLRYAFSPWNISWLFPYNTFSLLFFFSLESIRKKSGSNLMATHLCHTFCPKLRWRRCSAIVNKVEMYSSRLSLSHAIFFGLHKIQSKVGNVDPTYTRFT